jgi:hypothetical protein
MVTICCCREDSILLCNFTKQACSFLKMYHAHDYEDFFYSHYLSKPADYRRQKHAKEAGQNEKGFPAVPVGFW